jgi:hypothetical protein
MHILLGRWPTLLVCLVVTGCGAENLANLNLGGAASLAAVPVLGRTLPDAIYSTITGKDCSAVRLEQGKSYCRHPEPSWTEEVAAQPACSRSLAGVDCWTNPDVFSNRPTTVAAAPKPTAEQEVYRVRGWLSW